MPTHCEISPPSAAGRRRALAAQAGVRYSLENPRAYIDANLIGTYNVLALARGVRHLLLASTSSVDGANAAMPFRETDRTDHPLTLYAATKKATEHMAHAYAHLWKTPTTAFRFFAVYGPCGRPDMALFKFVAATLKGEPIAARSMRLRSSGLMRTLSVARFAGCKVVGFRPPIHA